MTRSAGTAITSSNLKSLRFRKEREADWAELERLVNLYEKRSASALSDSEILAAPVLYRSTLSSLSVARSTSLDQGLVDYLESLCTRAYFFIYGSRATFGEKISTFFQTEWHSSVKAMPIEILMSLLCLVFGAVIAALLITQSDSWYFVFVPEALANGRDPSASANFLESTIYDQVETDGLSFFATFLFTHNAQVSLMAFALGFAFGIPSALLIFWNGATLGAMLTIYFKKGLGVGFIGWLSIHGTTELFAIILAGAAGMHIGRAVAFPGLQSRLDAVTASGARAGLVMAGVIIMLFIAGMLEGFARQLVTDDVARYSIAGGVLMVWLAYFYLPRPRSKS